MSDFISLPFLGLPAMFDKVGGGVAGPHARAYGIVLKKRKIIV